MAQRPNALEMVMDAAPRVTQLCVTLDRIDSPL